MGSYRKDRDPTKAPEAPPPAIIGPAPVSFSPAQRRSWAELAPAVAGVYAASDRPTFCLMVKLHALVESPPKKLAPYVYAGMVSRLAALLEGFGCSPRSRRTVEVVKKPETQDESEAFLFGGGDRSHPCNARPCPEFAPFGETFCPLHRHLPNPFPSAAQGVGLKH